MVKLRKARKVKNRSDFTVSPLKLRKIPYKERVRRERISIALKIRSIESRAEVRAAGPSVIGMHPGIKATHFFAAGVERANPKVAQMFLNKVKGEFTHYTWLNPKVI